MPLFCTSQIVWVDKLRCFISGLLICEMKVIMEATSQRALSEKIHIVWNVNASDHEFTSVHLLCLLLPWNIETQKTNQDIELK